VPKEITHWWLACEVLAGLTADGAADNSAPDASRRENAPALARLLRQNRNLFLLGSVGPDFLFYYLSGPENERFREAAMTLHGSDGGDTLAILAKTAEEYGDELSEAVWAFLFGYVCHVIADSVFHPLVLYFAGKGDEKAQYNHQLFESALDLYIKDIPDPRCVPLRITRLTAGMEMDRKAFLKLLGFVCFGGGEYNAEALKICLKRYERIQAAFWNPLARTGARLLGVLSPKLRHYVPAFYQKEYFRLAPVFARTFRYRHPVTGAEYERSVGNLRDEVVLQAAGIAGVFEKILTDSSEDPVGDLEKIHGPNLETGLHGDNAKRILYTAPGGVAEIFRPELHRSRRTY
jgi:hypothetical protein